jgi:hypothetical protein
VRSAVVEPEAMQAVGAGLGEGLDAAREHFGGQRGPREPAPRTGGRRHGPRDLAPREERRDGAQRRHPTGGEAPPADGDEAEAAFSLAEAPQRTRMGGRHPLLEACLTGGLTHGQGRRGLWWGALAPRCAWP